MDGIWRESIGGTAGKLTAPPAKTMLANVGQRQRRCGPGLGAFASRTRKVPHEPKPRASERPEQTRIAADFASSPLASDLVDFLTRVTLTRTQ